MKNKIRVILWAAAVILLVVAAIFLTVAVRFRWFAVDNRMVDPGTGERFVPLWQDRQGAAESLRALADFPVWGPDVSYWQVSMDMGKLKATGATFVIIRNSHGLVEDTRWRENANNAVAVGLWCAHYIYIEPGSASASVQAKFFVNLLKQSPCTMPPVMDVEDRGGLSPDGLANYLQEFADIVEAGTEKVPVIYTRATFWNEYVADRADWEDYFLWIARYVSIPDWPYPPYTPRDWPGPNDWSLWQWTSSGSGSYYGASSTYIDLNVYDGNLLQFLDEFGLEAEPEYNEIRLPPGRYEISVDGEGNVVFSPMFGVYLPVIGGSD